MIRIDSILCPVDLSEPSRRALDLAMALARRYEAPVTVLHVHAAEVLHAPHGFPAVEPIVVPPADLPRMQRDVEAFVDAEAAAGVALRRVLLSGDPAAVILEQAKATAADLIVLGTHGRSGLPRLVLGSVAERVLRRASCPVLTVPPHAPDAVPAAAVLFRHILCAVDFSECSMRALRHAAAMAEEADAELIVLHALGQPLDTAAVGLGGYAREAAVALAEQRQRAAQLARDRILAALPADAGTYCHIETAVAEGRPGPEILRVAGARSADLIVLGVSGDGTLERLVFGSTAQDVVRGATCPVMTVPARG